MTKTEIKNAQNNELIIELVDLHSIIISKNGFRCNGLIKEENMVLCELMNRGLLTQSNVDYLNR